MQYSSITELEKCMYQCQTSNCGYLYNPEKGDRKGKIPKGTLFQDLPEDWKCPICGATKKMFRPLVPAGQQVG
ncbi:MAG TPA: rubredoxin [Desulfomonilaceae bacterium]|nr:rubredoxin [Desulfomonilaceae bacterium]